MALLMKSFVEVPRTARYYTLGELKETTKNLWLVFHGYGQLAEYFIRHFDELDSDKNLVVAFEGLSKFYVEGLTGRVGASWMTAEDREHEIKDQTNYINKVIEDCGVDLRSNKARVVVLGFSQGTSTAVRWIANTSFRPAELILWAGSFPHDVDAASNPEVFSGLKVHFAYGNEDQFLSQINVQERIAGFENLGMKMHVWPFEGKHVMDKPTLKRIVDSFEG